MFGEPCLSFAKVRILLVARGCRRLISGHFSLYAQTLIVVPLNDFLKNTIKILLPFVFGVGIMWWMYRGTDWAQSFACVADARFWLPMSLSLLFGIVPQVLRALRWKMAIEPLGEPVRLGTCVDAVFMSYAASLVVPRVGEVTRCGTLKKYDGTSFTQSLGTVVTERLVDSVVMLLLTALAFLAGASGSW